MQCVPIFPSRRGGNCNSEDDALGPPISTAMSVGQLAVELYVYQVPTNVPNGVVVKNAADVLAQAAAEELGGGVIAFEIAPPRLRGGVPVACSLGGWLLRFCTRASGRHRRGSGRHGRPHDGFQYGPRRPRVAERSARDAPDGAQT